MWDDKFLSMVTMRGYDEVLEGKLLVTGELEDYGTTRKVSTSKQKVNDLNKKAFKSCSDKILFGIVTSAKTKHLY